MPRTMTVSDSVIVAASPDAVYALVSDPTATARWSPENLGATRSGTGPMDVGDEFVGHNRRGRTRWSTGCVVTAAEPGVRFAFRVRRWGLSTPRLRIPIATWEYRLTPTADTTDDSGGTAGTEVTETWVDDRRSWPDWFTNPVDRVLTRTTFADFQRRNIATSLARLKDVVEARA